MENVERNPLGVEETEENFGIWTSTNSHHPDLLAAKTGRYVRTIAGNDAMKPGSSPLKKVSKDPGKRQRAPSGGAQPSSGSASKLRADLPMHTRAIQMVKTPHTVVNHSYVDYSLAPPTSEDNQQKPKPINEMDFHEKLHSMLGRIEFQDSIGWLPHGRAFRVAIPSRFEKTVCPEYFGHKRYSSFLYKLGVHGYKQISAGTDRGAYYSPVSSSLCD